MGNGRLKKCKYIPKKKEKPMDRKRQWRHKRNLGYLFGVDIKENGVGGWTTGRWVSLGQERCTISSEAGVINHRCEDHRPTCTGFMHRKKEIIWMEKRFHLFVWIFNRILGFPLIMKVGNSAVAYTCDLVTSAYHKHFHVTSQLYTYLRILFTLLTDINLVTWPATSVCCFMHSNESHIIS